jgi:hypothetical protein
MKQVVLNIDEKKYKFFMELIKNFDFITVAKEDTAKKRVLRQIAKGMQSAVHAGEGEITTKAAKSFLMNGV